MQLGIVNNSGKNVCVWVCGYVSLCMFLCVYTYVSLYVPVSMCLRICVCIFSGMAKCFFVCLEGKFIWMKIPCSQLGKNTLFYKMYFNWNGTWMMENEVSWEKPHSMGNLWL